LKDISASKLSELRGDLNAKEQELRKVQSKLTLLNKEQLKARKDYDESLKRINKQFEKSKICRISNSRRNEKP